MNKVLETPFLQTKDTLGHRQIISFAAVSALLLIAVFQKPFHASSVALVCLLAGVLSSIIALTFFRVPLSKSLLENIIYALSLFLFLPLQMSLKAAFIVSFFGIFFAKQIFGPSGAPFSPILSGLALSYFMNGNQELFSAQRFLFIELIPAPFLWGAGFLLIWRGAISMFFPLAYLSMMLILHLLNGISIMTFLWNPFLWGTAFFILGDTRLFLNRNLGGVFLALLAAILVWFLNEQLKSPMGFVWPFLMISVLTFPMRRWRLA